MGCHPLACVYGKCVISQRYILCFMSFLGILNSYSMRMCLNIALTEMVLPKPPKEVNETSGECPDDASSKIKVQVPVKSMAYQATLKKGLVAATHVTKSEALVVSLDLQSVVHYIGSIWFPHTVWFTTAISSDFISMPWILIPSLFSEGGIYNWTETQQGLILGAFFPGYVITHLPGGVASDIFGGKHVLAGGVLLSAVLTGLTPLGVKLGSWWMLMVMRFIIGIVQGPLFPSVNTLLAKWVPQRERSTLGALVLTGPQVGSITGNLITAYLIADVGNWQSVFYFWAAMSIIWYFFFLIMCFSEPNQHPFITAEEKEMLNTEIGPSKRYKIPWLKMFLYPPSLALAAGEVGHGVVFFLIVTELPKYFKDVLKFNIKENGLLNALPYVALWICGAISGVISDMLITKEIVSITFIRKLYTTIASVGPSICIVLAGYMGCNRVAASAMFILTMFFKGPIYSALRINALDITRNFAGVLTAFFNGIGALAFVPFPSIIAVMASNHTVEEWRSVFWIVFAIASVTNVIYVIWGSGERAEWDLNPEEL